MIFQDPFNSLDPKLTVREAVREPLEIHDFDDKDRRVREALEHAELRPVDSGDVHVVRAPCADINASLFSTTAWIIVSREGFVAPFGRLSSNVFALFQIGRSTLLGYITLLLFFLSHG